MLQNIIFYFDQVFFTCRGIPPSGNAAGLLASTLAVSAASWPAAAGGWDAPKLPVTCGRRGCCCPSCHTHISSVAVPAADAVHGHGYVGNGGQQPPTPGAAALQAGRGGQAGGSTAGAERTRCVERARFVRPDLCVWVFSEALDDPCGSGVRPGIALLQQAACLQV